MTTQSAGQATAAPRGGWTGGQTGRGGGRTRGRSGAQGNGRIDGQGGQVGGQGIELNDGVDRVLDFFTIIVQQLRNLLSTILAQVGDQGSNLGNGRNQNGDAINENVQGNLRNIIGNNDRRGCTYKDLLACNPKEYDGMVAAIDLTTIQKAMQIARTLTDEAIRNGSIKKNLERRGSRGKPSKDRNGRDDNKRTRTGNAFAITTNLVRRENTVWHPSVPPVTFTIYLRHVVALISTVTAGYLDKDCRVVHRNVNLGRGNNGNQARGRAFMLGAEEAR
uniref:Reverse transcriptase domain-containing protein n=1 Tax=Tanacetum cinerariifolium TaxID=118510 RepID=A0A6L2LT38_TANCI|nr:hypothetical protein [Tanacetum cinerariifolium]